MVFFNDVFDLINVTFGNSAKSLRYSAVCRSRSWFPNSAEMIIRHVRQTGETYKKVYSGHHETSHEWCGQQSLWLPDLCLLMYNPLPWRSIWATSNNPRCHYQSYQVQLPTFMWTESLNTKKGVQGSTTEELKGKHNILLVLWGGGGVDPLDLCPWPQ
jgi:hypothetical protein